MPKILFLIENVSFSLDTRVQRQSRTLMDAGGSIRVICPKSEGECFHDTIDDIEIYRYWKPSFGQGFLSHIAEYITSIIAHTFLTALVFVRHGFDVIHVANPPDILWLVAMPYKLFGKLFVYDQHDLVPELYEVRFKDRLAFLYRIICLFEFFSYRFSDHVITTNETFRKKALERGKVLPKDVTVVRNGPHLSKDYPEVALDPETRGLGDCVVGYLGIMNPQDHLEIFLEAAHIVRNQWNRTDIGFVMVGSGDSFDSLQKLRQHLGLSEAVKMTGTLPWSQVLSVLSATDICVQPDPPTVFNKNLTMNKLMEYMALGKAVIAFDMPETRLSGGEFVVYVTGDTAQALAEKILELADNPERRKELGEGARQRIVTELCWEKQQECLLDVYKKIMPDKFCTAISSNCD